MPYADDTRAARTVAVTPEMRSCLQLAFRASLIRLATDLSIILLIVAIAIWVGNYLYVVVPLLFGLGIGTPGVARSAYRLRRSLDRPGLLRLFGPLTVTEHRRNGIGAYTAFRWAELANGERLELGEGLYRQLATVGAQRPDERGRLRKLLGGQTVYQLPPVVVTYSETGRLLLDVRTPGGDGLARDSRYAADDPHG